MYGDAFVTGFVEGGDFSALVSVKVRDSAAGIDFRARLAAMFESAGSGVVPQRAAGDMSDLGEIAIAVSWTGEDDIAGAQAGDWTLESLREAARAFPHHAIHSPVRTRYYNFHLAGEGA